MGHYVNLTMEQARSILFLYSLGEVKELTPLSLGISNSNYQVKLASGEYVLLKVSNDKNIGQLRKEQEILLYLNDQKFPYSLRPFLTQKKDMVYQVGEHFGVIYPFVQGAAPQINEATCFAIGKALAALHLVPVDTQRAKELNLHLRSYDEIGHNFHHIDQYCQRTDALEDFKQAFSELLANRELLQKDDFPTGLIHGDLYFDNTLFHQGSLVKILDFEQSGIGPFILDLGISISGTCLIHSSAGENRKNLHQPFIDAYIEGYESVRPLEKREKTHLKTFILLGLFSISLWRIQRFTEGNLDPKKAKHYQELIFRARDWIY